MVAVAQGKGKGKVKGDSTANVGYSPPHSGAEKLASCLARFKHISPPITHPSLNDIILLEIIESSSGSPLGHVSKVLALLKYVCYTFRFLLENVWNNCQYLGKNQALWVHSYCYKIPWGSNKSDNRPK